MTREERALARPGQLAVPPMPPELHQGRCVTSTQPPGLWHSADPAEREAAVLICHSCPVTRICLEYVLSFSSADDLAGIFGGTTPDQRAQIRRQRRRAAAGAA